MDELMSLPDAGYVLRISMRLGVAALLGGLVGAEREWVGKAAGLRTHMLVALGAAAFTMAPLEAGAAPADVTRTIQGIATGIGFIGAGTILKRTDRDEIEGLTTAAGIWLTGAIGMAVGLGQAWLAIVCVFSAWLILAALDGFGRWLQRRKLKVKS